MNRGCKTAALLLFVLSQARFCEAYSTVVKVAAWTTTGERIEKIWAVLTPLGGGDAHEGSGKLVKLSVQTGDYILRVSASGFRMRQEVLRAYQPSVFRSVALRVAVVEASTVSSLTGTVRNYDGNVRDLRVRLMGLYGDELWEAVPDRQGSFRFPADEGAYVLLVVADSGKGIAIIDSTPIRIPLGKQQTLTIDLKGKHGTLLLPEPQ